MIFNDHIVFPFRLNHAENISVKWLNDIDEQHIGPGLSGFLQGQQTIRKRKLSVEVLVNGDDVDDLESFFEGIGCQAFWLPDMPRDFSSVESDSEDGTLVLVSAGDVESFLDADLTYALCCLPHDGGDPVLTLISSVAAVGDDYQLILADDLGAVSSETHECGLATLVSVTSDTVSFSPHTSELWSLSVDLTEQPFEVADPLPVRSIEYQYTFHAGDHLGGSVDHKYTTGVGDDDFEAIDIIHTDLSFGLLSSDNKCTISMQAVPYNPFAGWTPFYLGPPINVIVYKVETIDAETTTEILFSGECVEMVRQGDRLEAEFQPRAFKGKVPNFFASTRDNMDQWAEHDAEDFMHETALVEKTDSSLAVTWSDTLDPAILENGHIVCVPDDGLAQVRDIYAVTGVLGDTSIYLRISGPISAEVEDTIFCYQGYDGSPESYAEMFGSLTGFGGHPCIPEENPSFDAIEMNSDTAKK